MQKISKTICESDVAGSHTLRTDMKTDLQGSSTRSKFDVVYCFFVDQFLLLTHNTMVNTLNIREISLIQTVKQMSYRRELLLFVLGMTLLLPVTKSFAAAPVSICGETLPPFLYESGDASQETRNVAGIHVENFRLLAELTGLEFAFSVLPWKRCLYYVDNYSEPGDHEITIDATFNTERAEKFHYVGPLYAMGTAVFYSRHRFPDGPISKKTGSVISWINEMQHFSICGMLGWNYEGYYSRHGFPRSVKVIRTPAGFQGLFSMLSAGRCDLVETQSVLVLGAMMTGELEMPKDIACSKLNEVPQKFYLMVSRKSPRAEELVTRLSTALIYLQRTLQWKSLEDEAVLPVSESTKRLRKCLR
jgi:polar amino acid transport system substrate-binding protein